MMQEGFTFSRLMRGLIFESFFLYILFGGFLDGEWYGLYYLLN